MILNHFLIRLKFFFLNIDRREILTFASETLSNHTKFFLIKRALTEVYTDRFESEVEYINNLKAFQKGLPEVVLSSRQKDVLVLIFKDKFLTFNALLDEEISIIESVMNRLDIRLDTEYRSRVFYYKFLQNKLYNYGNYVALFKRLERIKLQVEYDKTTTKYFINSRFFDQFPPERALKVSLHFKELSLDFSESARMLVEFQKVTNLKSLDRWLDFLLSERSSRYSFYVTDRSFNLFLKLFGKTRNKKLKERLRYCLRTDTVLYQLINDDFDFQNLITNDSTFINLLSRSSDMRQVVQGVFGAYPPPKLVRLFSEMVLKGRVINFSLPPVLEFIRSYDINHVYTIMSKLENPLNHFNLDLNESLFFKGLLSHFSIQHQIRLIIEATSNVTLTREMITHYKEINRVFSKYDFPKKRWTIVNLAEFIAQEYKKNKEINVSLNQSKYFSQLDLIDGHTAGELRFEVPKDSFSLFEYGKIMGNCIFTYTNRCVFKQCVVIGVYVNNKLTYNIEIGFLISPIFDNDSYDDSRIKTRAFNRRILTQIEKRHKSPMSSDEHKHISDILKKFNLIT